MAIETLTRSLPPTPAAQHAEPDAALRRLLRHPAPFLAAASR